MAASRTRGSRAGALLVVAGVTLVTGAVWAAYVGYGYMESTRFCAGQCHTAMAPQSTAHERSAHTGVACVQCHVSNGVGPHLSSKLAGSSRVVRVAFNSYRGPIRSPYEHSRKISDRCSSCHRLENAIPSKPMFVRYSRLDESNTPEQISLTLELATNQASANGPRGAHWHANPGVRVTYAASDPLRQNVHSIHVRRTDGTETSYSSNQATADGNPTSQLVEYEMGCVDCHNRGGHESVAPETQLDQALHDGRIPASVPWMKAYALQALTSKVRRRSTSGGVLESLVDQYQTHAPGVLLEYGDALRAAGKVLESIHERIVFPNLRADHTSYPNNLGHRHWPGCFRCHDGQHVTPDGKPLASDCGQTCHSAPRRGPVGKQAVSTTELGEDWHPWPSPAKVLDIPGHRQLLCSNCHRAGGTPKRTCDDCHTP